MNNQTILFHINWKPFRSTVNLKGITLSSHIKRITPPRILTLEDMITYVGDDELVEVTPKSLRLRKKLLDPNDRKRLGRGKEERFDFIEE